MAKKRKNIDLQQLAFGGKPIDIYTPQEMQHDWQQNYQIAQLEAQQKAMPYEMLGNLAMNTGMSMVAKGTSMTMSPEQIIKENPGMTMEQAKGKLATTKKMNKFANNMGQYYQGLNMLGQFGENQGWFGLGGQIPGQPQVPVEIEGQEVGETPDGQVFQAKGPSHEQGGIQTALPGGTEMYSKRVKVDGVTMADRKKKRKKKEVTLEELFAETQDTLTKNSLKRTQQLNELEDQADTKIQEQVSAIMKQREALTGQEQFAYGGEIQRLGFAGEPVGGKPKSKSKYTSYKKKKLPVYIYDIKQNKNVKVDEIEVADDNDLSGFRYTSNAFYLQNTTLDDYKKGKIHPNDKQHWDKLQNQIKRGAKEAQEEFKIRRFNDIIKKKNGYKELRLYEQLGTDRGFDGRTILNVGSRQQYKNLEGLSKFRDSDQPVRFVYLPSNHPALNSTIANTAKYLSGDKKGMLVSDFEKLGLQPLDYEGEIIDNYYDSPQPIEQPSYSVLMPEFLPNQEQQGNNSYQNSFDLLGNHGIPQQQSIQAQDNRVNTPQGSPTISVTQPTVAKKSNIPANPGRIYKSQYENYGGGKIHSGMFDQKNEIDKLFRDNFGIDLSNMSMEDREKYINGITGSTNKMHSDGKWGKMHHDNEMNAFNMMNLRKGNLEKMKLISTGLKTMGVQPVNSLNPQELKLANNGKPTLATNDFNGDVNEENKPEFWGTIKKAGKSVLGNSGVGGLGFGDMLGIYGAYQGIQDRLDVVRQMRENDRPHENFYKDWGIDGINTLDQSMGIVEKNKLQAQQDLQRNGLVQQNRMRNGARSINTLRALDLANLAQTNIGIDKLTNTADNHISRLMQEKANMQNQRDGMVAQGAYTADINTRKDDDNYFTQLDKAYAGKSLGLQQMGKYINDARRTNADLKQMDWYRDYMERNATQTAKDNAAQRTNDMLKFERMYANSDFYKSLTPEQKKLLKKQQRTK